MPRRAFEACSSCGCAKADCGLLSRRGLCQECSQMRMRDGARQGGVKRKSWFMPPSHTPQGRRTAKRLKVRPASAQASLCEHRLAMPLHAPGSAAAEVSKMAGDLTDERRCLHCISAQLSFRWMQLEKYHEDLEAQALELEHAKKHWKSSIGRFRNLVADAKPVAARKVVASEAA